MRYFRQDQTVLVSPQLNQVSESREAAVLKSCVVKKRPRVD